MTAVIVILLLTGFILLAVELTIIPGFGVPGMLGAIAFVAGSILAFREYGGLWGGAVTVGTMILCIVAIVVAGKSKLGRSFTLKTPPGKTAVPDDMEKWVDQEGVAESMLRPSGSALFGNERLTVLTDGQFLKKGTPIRIVQVLAGKLVVEAIEQEDTSDNKNEELNKDT